MYKKIIFVLLIFLLSSVLMGCSDKNKTQHGNIIGGDLFYLSVYYQEEMEIYLPLLIVDKIEKIEVISVIIEGNYPKNVLNLSLSNVVYEGIVNKYNLYYIYLKTSIINEIKNVNILEIIFKINDDKYSYKPKKLFFLRDNYDNFIDFNFLDIPIQTPQQKNMDVNLIVSTTDIKYMGIETTSPHLNIESINGHNIDDFMKEQYNGIQLINIKIKFTDNFNPVFNFGYNIVFKIRNGDKDYKIITPILHMDKYVEWLKEKYD